MKTISAGLLMFKNTNNGVEVFLAHPGGPFFKSKDAGYWTIPKGLVNEGEEFLEAACREFKEETGMVPEGPFISLGNVQQKGGKVVHAWAFENNYQELQQHISNVFRMEWPPKSGVYKEFPEIDQVGFFSLETAIQKINEAQRMFIQQLRSHLGASLKI
jgi:predicted NUDIX family NTP pyrophosphohydrolase